MTMAVWLPVVGYEGLHAIDDDGRPLVPIGDRCVHVPTAPGQKVCTCLDEVMWLRLLVELQARRIAQLEVEVQRGEPRVIPVSKKVGG